MLKQARHTHSLSIDSALIFLHRVDCSEWIVLQFVRIYLISKLKSESS